MAHKLLLADDSVTIQRVIELTFADEDVEVTTVGDGQLAIERLDADRFDIVLADVDMPKRDGYEVAAYVKSRPKLAHIPVVLLTGAFEPIDQARADAAGSSDVLAKPFEPQMVINRVKELLGRKRTDQVKAYASADPALHGSDSHLGSPQPLGSELADGSQSVSLDDYFDQLDAAFSNLQPGATPTDGSEEVEWPAELVTPAAPVAFAAPAAPPVEHAPAFVAPVEPVAPPTLPREPIVPVNTGATAPSSTLAAWTAPAPPAPAPSAPVAPNAPDF